MITCIRKLHANQSGNAFSVVVIVLLLVVVAAAVIPIEGLRTYHGGDIILKESAAESVRGAAMCINDIALKDQTYVIDPIRANRKFVTLLTANMGIGPNFNPGNGTGFTSPIHYVLLVVNPPNKYSNSMVFTETNPQGEVISSPSLPATFYIDKTTINMNGSGEKVTLQHPGCIAIVTAGIRPVTRSNATIVTKWACAELEATPTNNTPASTAQTP